MFKILTRYFWWTYERGSLHYDIMVSAILLFIFISPFFIDFKDRPVTTAATHASEVLVREAGTKGSSNQFIYQVRTEDMHGADTDAALRKEILKLIEPVSGEVTLEKYEPVTDATGRVVAYNAWVLR
ncbi:MAG TPA: hypothetical protein VGC07_07335 [Granulicella sp.]